MPLVANVYLCLIFLGGSFTVYIFVLHRPLSLYNLKRYALIRVMFLPIFYGEYIFSLNECNSFVPCNSLYNLKLCNKVITLFVTFYKMKSG